MPREQWQAMQPVLTPDNEVVIQVWEFCGGWQPHILPVALAYYGVRDPELMIEQLLALRDLAAKRPKG